MLMKVLKDLRRTHATMWPAEDLWAAGFRNDFPLRGSAHPWFAGNGFDVRGPYAGGLAAVPGFALPLPPVSASASRTVTPSVSSTGQGRGQVCSGRSARANTVGVLLGLPWPKLIGF